MIKAALLPAGSTSDDAARQLFGGAQVEYRYHQLIADVFLSTVNGHTDYSVIPIENTIDGSVSLHTDWLVHEVELPIQAEWVYPSVQNLIGRNSESLDGSGELDYDRIVKVMSHPVAMAQCTRFLRERLPHAELENVSSTTEAIRMVKDNPGAGWAAIGQRSGAALHGLDVLLESVTDHNNNYTRFLLVGHKPFKAREPDAFKTTIQITLPEDYPGALHQVLSAFAWRRINLSRIESRPTKKQLGSYYFLMDIEMSLDTVLLPAAIAEIEAIGCQVRIMGSYPSFAVIRTNPEV
ncbi:prephenate dehydratase [Paenibacillus darwinianus]|uniref:Prephenate dehydratase n=1 Tax=Paenibacillus darwinianus TaxID=1380763 RepID=A0A9W5RZB3_9BACL|nr:prephenate dehydratase [Paenibacillus darwinianus]EXX85555.1 prephenate dehydratase [Paenibacillus darwinianus]EXX85600.1 prephenate dehydratase [Paenibacillus darwinianus]EXX85669.1 prephenate dehydratase [Paenibacillus darwinianus]